MKKSELAFTVVLVPLDFLLVFLAAITAYSVRFGWLAALRPVAFDLPWNRFLLLAAGAGLLFVMFMALSGLYAVRGPRRLTMEISRIFFASSASILTFIVIVFFRRELFSSRFIILAAWIVAFIYLSLGRVLIRLLQRLLVRFGVGVRRVIVIGGDERVTKTLTAAFAKNPAFGFQMIKTIAGFDDEAEKELAGLAATGALDEVIVTNPDLSREDLSRILGFCESRQLAFKYSADLLATHSHNMELSTVAGLPIVEIKGTRLDGWGRVLKRIFDVIGSLLLIILTSPIMLLAALAVAIDSRGPVFFSRLDDGSPVTRVGEHGRPFRYFKFRSMRPNTHNLRYTELADRDTRKEGPLVKIKDDPRVTRVGTFIRKYSIDELPELFLVFTGKMSLVGPRPHLPEEVAKYKDHHRRVFTVKPGITGLAQISGRADLNFDEEVRLDTYYIENWSPWLDLAILIKTPLAVLSRKGAY
ncbi:MAG: sugar transferase [Patescibacteria group bacterium]|jgi:exopolysaccharide biosynthesis polyprenyl glycosylphosphotransferase